MITITVQLFANLAERAATREVTLELDDDATVRDAFDALLTRTPSLEAVRSGIAFALNDAYVPADTPVTDGAVLSLIPPVSGG